MFSTCLQLIRHSSGQWAEKRSRSDTVWTVWPDIALVLREFRTLKGKQQYTRTPEIYLTFSASPQQKKKKRKIHNLPVFYIGVLCKR